MPEAAEASLRREVYSVSRLNRAARELLEPIRAAGHGFDEGLVRRQILLGLPLPEGLIIYGYKFRPAGLYQPQQ